MVQLEQLVKPTWGVEKWINKAWEQLTDAEKVEVKTRLDDLFSQGLPFKTQHDTILYLYLFSLLTQVETLGMQIPLKFADKLSTATMRRTMRQQLVDETFHALVFLEVTQTLSAPYALPPAYNLHIEKFMFHVVNEPDLKTSVVLVNLISEGWIEEIFVAMQKHQVAPRLFDIILEDESRHLEETDLYLELGLPDKTYLKEKLAQHEEELVSTIFFQPKHAISLVGILGVDGLLDLVANIDKKHQRLLAKIGLEPSEKWRFFMDLLPSYVLDIFHDHRQDESIKPSLTRQTLSAMWDAPSSPTMSSVFSVNVTKLAFFEKKYPSETLTCLALQALSRVIADNPVLKNYMAHNKIYQPRDAYVGLAVKLPQCGDSIGLIEFKNCHEMNLSDLSKHIQHDLQIMTYCFKKVEELKNTHPYLMDIFNDMLVSRSNEVYTSPLFSRPSISLSNIGHWGYEVVVSPLLPNETVKLTLGKIEKKPVWQPDDNTFAAQDILPVGMSVDHRVFDGNLPVPYLYQAAFEASFHALLQGQPSLTPARFSNPDKLIKMSERLLETDLEFGFRYLFFACHVWKNYSDQLTTFMNKPTSFMQKIRELVMS